MSATIARRAPLVGVAALAVALGIGGGTALALWDDDEVLTASIGTGMVGLAVEKLGTHEAQVADGPGSRPGVTLGPAEAERLLADGEVTVGIRVDARADGNKGLRYGLELPVLDGASLLGNSTVRVFRVAADTACTPETEPLPGTPVATWTPADADGDGTYVPGTDPGWDGTGLGSVPVAADYDAPWTAVERWCVVAELGDMPDEGSYTNTATVAVEVDGATYTGRDSWYTDVTTAADPAGEPAHTIRFSHTTFRPGE
ncbi:hypothetical protein KZX45_04965 [Georgenia sp. EYE_87]|uniref:hypothetical protein n=1 Tax=Georgenia sp. EYE_87 TaxID=2853448 RepID=UPI00200389C0|nr:hypothetical protein [Georgenia sp. EYE_87]MCK6209889.1 hypothetical protein [Georgenia sp. EYE_87]